MPIKEKYCEKFKVSMKTLIWNIRFVNTQKAFMRLNNLHKRHQFYFVGLMEPMVNRSELEK